MFCFDFEFDFCEDIRIANINQKIYSNQISEKAFIDFLTTCKHIIMGTSREMSRHLVDTIQAVVFKKIPIV